MVKYKLDKSVLSFIEKPQFELFESEFEKVTKNNIFIEYNHKGYKVNNLKIEDKMK